MFPVHNIHARDLSATREQVAGLIASLSSADDRLWPRQWWPAMRFDRPLSVGADGGHGPIRYVVADYTPGLSITFRFTSPRGFHGTHSYLIEPIDDTHTRLRHEIVMHISGLALLSWPLVYRPLHNALLEDSLDIAAANLQGSEPARRQWAWGVRLLRGMVQRSRKNRR